MATYSSKFRVFQNWGTPQGGTPGEQNVFVFGPRYVLHRYTNEDEREQITPIGYVSQGEQQVFEGVIDVAANLDIDDASFNVYAENAYVRLGTGSENSVTCEGSYLDGKLFYKDCYLTDVKKPEDKELSFDLARPVEAGDYVAVKTTNNGIVSYDLIRIESVAIGKKKEEYDGEATAESVGTEVILESGLPDGSFDDSGELTEGTELFLVTKLNGVALDKDSYSFTGSDLIVYNQDSVSYAAVSIGDKARALLRGDLFVSYRAMYVGHAGEIAVVNNSADAELALGKADPDNPVSFGVFNAFVGGAPVVYYYVTQGEKQADFAKALTAAELNSTLYYLVPMSQNKKVLADVAAHVDRMSSAEVKRWRIMLCCTAVDKVVNTEFVVDAVGTYTRDKKEYVTLKCSKGAPDVQDGDVITVGDSTFIAVSRLNSTTILTTATKGGVTGDAVLTHELSSTEYATAAAGSAKALGTFRAVDVFPKTYGFDGDMYSSMFVAPIIAGMKASVPPHAPITNADVPGVDDLPDIYTGDLSSYDLDTVAAGGVLVITQDQRGDGVYVRKQLTTGATSDVLAKSELSMMVNFDYISKYFNNVMEGFKGSYNVTEGLVDMVATELRNALYILEQSGDDPLLGTPVLDGSRVESVYIDPTNATRLIAHVVVVLPAPFNEMDLFLTVSVQATTAAETEQE